MCLDKTDPSNSVQLDKSLLKLFTHLSCLYLPVFPNILYRNRSAVCHNGTWSCAGHFQFNVNSIDNLACWSRTPHDMRPHIKFRLLLSLSVAQNYMCTAVLAWNGYRLYSFSTLSFQLRLACTDACVGCLPRIFFSYSLLAIFFLLLFWSFWLVLSDCICLLCLLWINKWRKTTWK